MANLISFMNSFLSYLLLFGIIVVLVIIACFIGIRWRKVKDEKEEVLKQEALKEEVLKEEKIQQDHVMEENGK